MRETVQNNDHKRQKAKVEKMLQINFWLKVAWDLSNLIQAAPKIVF